MFQKEGKLTVTILWLNSGLQISGSSVTEDADSHDMAQSKYSIDQILDKAAEFMDMYNYEMAQKFCQRALEIDNDNVRALEATATLLLEVRY